MRTTRDRAADVGGPVSVRLLRLAYPRVLAGALHLAGADIRAVGPTPVVSESASTSATPSVWTHTGTVYTDGMSLPISSSFVVEFTKVEGGVTPARR